MPYTNPPSEEADHLIVHDPSRAGSLERGFRESVVVQMNIAQQMLASVKTDQAQAMTQSQHLLFVATQKLRERRTSFRIRPETLLRNSTLSRRTGEAFREVIL